MPRQLYFNNYINSAQYLLKIIYLQMMAILYLMNFCFFQSLLIRYFGSKMNYISTCTTSQL